MLGPRSHRWKSSASVDVDAFALTDRSWLLFAYVKDPALGSDALFWPRLAAEFSATAGGARVLAISRALKTEKSSEPLPTIALGGETPAEAWCREGWLKYRLETGAVLNPGLFLDQALNREYLGDLIQHFIARNKGEFGEHDGALNLFSFTGSFSIAALGAGVRATTSVDVSGRYLEWEKQNFEANFGGSEQLSHRLIKDDARDFLRRAAKKGARYRWVVIDPPTFSRGQGKAFKLQDELGTMVGEAASILSPGGAILASGNDSRWEAKAFFAEMEGVAKRHALRFERGRTSPDFPPSHALKSAWFFAAG